MQQRHGQPLPGARTPSGEALYFIQDKLRPASARAPDRGLLNSLPNR
jgi:hypothetical protein